MERIELLERRIQELEQDPHNERLISKAKRILRNPNMMFELPASEMFLIDEIYSKDPTAMCEHHELGLPPCKRGEGKYCYCLKPCESKMELNGSGRLLSSSRKLLKHKGDKAIRELSKEYEEQFNEHEKSVTALDDYYNDMVQRIIGVCNEDRER